LRIAAIWQNHAGRLSALKAVTFALVPLPAAVLAARFFAHDLGGRPILEVLHGLGDWTARFLLLTLAVTPARTVLDWPRVLLLRRMLGVTTACYGVAHLTMYCVDQNFHMLLVVSEIVRRFYLTIGFVTLSGLVVLGVTSTNRWQKRLGRRWKQLHRIVYALAALGLFHYFLQTKADVTDAVFLAGMYFWLMFWRLAPRRWQGRLLLLPVLAVLAALATAGVEASWYGLATNVSSRRVLLANLYVFYSLRPAVEVLLVTLALGLVAALRRLVGRQRRPVSRRMARKPA
jgi:sulfoxide reductase heme-binding subunit YedZ